MGTYRKRNIVRQGKGWRYRLGIPTDLRTAFGKKKEWSRYLGDISENEAEKLARELTVRDDRRIAVLRSLTPDQRIEVIKHGALDDPSMWKRYLDGTEIGARFVEAIAIYTAPQATDDEVEQGRDALAIIRAKQQAGEMRHEVARGRKTLRRLAIGSENAMDQLLTNWRQWSKPRSEATVKKYRLYLNRFVACVGDMEPREVKPAHVRKWRDDLETNPKIKTESVAKHLEALNAMFRAARSAGVVEMVPSDGIKPTKQVAKFADATRKRPFKPEHVRTIFKAAETESADFKWMLRLLAYHGMRSGEAAQLRVEDVTTVLGMPVLSIHDRVGTVKNKHSVREIPIHPECLGIVDYAKARNGDWLFGTFLEWKGKRGEYFQKVGSVWLREKAAIVDPALTMHSFRHLWRQLARELSMPVGVSRAIMGHKLGSDVHEEYGGAPPIKQQAKWIAKIDPLA